MSTKAWFDYSTYMAHKLTQMQETYPDENWTDAKLNAAFEKAGFVGDSGAQAHFLKYGHKEDVSPNEAFDAEYYYQAKAIQYYGLKENGGLTKAEVEAKMSTYAKNMEGAIKAAGMDAWTHYVKYGTAEGVNPSNSFDTSDYMAAKVAAMAGSMSEDEVYAAFKKAGFNALSHYMQYAGKGDNEVPAGSTFDVPESEQIHIQEEGESTTFTKEIDDLKGTDGNDTFEGVQNTTFNTADKLVDPSTSDEDVLNVVMNNGDALVTVTNVEKINVNAKANGGTFNASSVTGAKEINAEVGNGKVLAVNDIQELTTVVGMSGRGTLNVAFADTALSGDSPAVSLALSGAGKDAENTSVVNLDSEGSDSIAAVNVATTGKNFVDLSAGEKAATYTITGDGENTLNLLHAVKSGNSVATTVDASAVESAAQTVAFSDGTNYETLVKDDSLTGGAGSDDTLIFRADADSKKAVAKVSGFENVTVKADGAAELDASSFEGVKALKVEALAAGDDLTAKGLAASIETVNLDGANAIGDVSLTWAAAPSSLTVNVGDTDADTSDDQAYGNLILNTATAATINSLGAADSRVTNTIADIQGDKLASLTLNATDNDLVVSNISTAPALKSLTVDTGDVGKGVFELTANAATTLTSMTVTGDGSATFGALANTAALKMDASDFKGDLTASFATATGAVTVEYEGDSRTTGTITTGTADDDVTVSNGRNTITTNAGADSVTLEGGTNTVVTGAGADTITAEKGTNTIQGGADNDIIKLGEGKDTVVFEADQNSNGTDAISGFTGGTDVLDVSAFIGAAKVFGGTQSIATNGYDAETGSDNVLIINDKATLATGDFAAAAAAGKVQIATGQDIFIVAYDASASATSANLYNVTGGANVGTNDTVELVGTLQFTGTLADADFVTA